MVKFKKTIVDSQNTYESAAMIDVDGDGILDIVCGEYWYKGPDFKEKKKMYNAEKMYYPLMEEYMYYDNAAIPMDVDGDGRMDLVCVSWFRHTLFWLKNPGGEGIWEKFVIDEDCPNGETILAHDIDHDGYDEIIPCTVRYPLHIYHLDRDENGRPLGTFTKHVIEGEPDTFDVGHGLGFADINGDGKDEVITPNGWYLVPSENVYGQKWLSFREWRMGLYASMPMVGCDVNNDGYMDIVYGGGHGYGLYWLEQKRKDFENSNWVLHVVDDAASQYHWMALADIDGDGENEIITGKRYKAHGDKDPGTFDPLVLSYYKPDHKGRLIRYIIDHGDASSSCGIGMDPKAGDFFGNGRVDILAPGVDGLAIYENLGSE